MPFFKHAHRHQLTILKQLAAPLPEANRDERVIVFAPHFDDETLGCGGLLAHKCQAGQKIKLVFMTNGRLSHGHLMPASELEAWRKREALEAAHRLGIASADIVFLDFPEGQLFRQQGQLVRKVTALLEAWQPAEIYRPFQHDILPDHVATHDIVKIALKQWGKTAVCYDYFVWFWHHWPWVTQPLRYRWALQGFVQNSIRYGVWGKRPFSHIYDITTTLPSKNHALQADRSQMEALQPGWATLGDVAGGQFLACLQQPFEAYRQEIIN